MLDRLVFVFSSLDNYMSGFDRQGVHCSVLRDPQGARQYFAGRIEFESAKDCSVMSVVRQMGCFGVFSAMFQGFR